MPSKRQAAPSMHKPSGPRWPDRYSRQTRFAPIGESGQRRLGQAAVLIVGCGALGASLAQHMARAGVGLVRIVDRDYVEPSNLQRQVLFDEQDALDALPKAVAAARKLGRINAEIEMDPHVLDVTAANVDALLEGMDAVLDGTDNAAARLLLSERCFRRGIPFFYGGIAGSQGMSASLIPGETACLRCLIGGGESGPEGDTCDTIGVIAPAVEWVAALQAAEALKWLSGRREAIRRTWLTGDLWTFRVKESTLPSPTVSCGICGKARTAEKGSHAAEAVTQEAARGLPAHRDWPGLMDGAHGAIERKQEAGESNSAVSEQPVSGSAVQPSREARPTSPRLAPAVLDRNRGTEPPSEYAHTAVLCGRDTVQVTMDSFRGVELSAAEAWLAARGCEVSSNPYLVKATLPEGERLVLFPDGRVLVQGTQEAARAIALCGSYLSGLHAASSLR